MLFLPCGYRESSGYKWVLRLQKETRSTIKFVCGPAYLAKSKRKHGLKWVDMFFLTQIYLSSTQNCLTSCRVMLRIVTTNYEVCLCLNKIFVFSKVSVVLLHMFC